MGSAGNGHEPVTEADLAAATAAPNGRVDLHSPELQHTIDKAKKLMRDNHTELLGAFCSFAESVDARLKGREVARFLILGRLTAMESRQADMERRLNMPPAA